MRAIAIVVLAGMVAGCGARAGPDDPANPPRLGRWSKDVHLAGATMNDASVTRAEVPFKLPADDIETIACTEPKLRSADELNDTIGKRGAKCHVDTVEADGADVSASGTCSFDDTGDTHVAGAIEMHGTQAADRIDMLSMIKVSARSPDGQTSQIRTSYKLLWTRLGDCG